MRNKKYQEPIVGNVTALSHEGRGVAKINGKTTFIRDALPKEDIKFHYTRRKGQYDEGQTVEVLTPAAERATPRCLHFGTCGGCSLQHLAHPSQLAHKESIVLEQLKHIGGNITPNVMLPPLTATPWHYRSKARLSVKHVPGKQKVLVGFRERNGRYVADLTRCEILHATIGNKITALSDLMMQLSVRDKIPQVEVAVAENATALVFRHLQPFTDTDKQLLMRFAQQEQFWLYLQPGGITSTYRLYPDNDEALYYSFPTHHITLQFEPLDFTQVNQALNKQMVNQALQLLDLTPQDRVLDLFCGLGNFSLPIARYAHSVTGVEGEATMVKRAYHNAAINQLANVQFFAADLTAPANHQPWHNTYDKIIVDPPRTGALAVVENINLFQAKTIVYVSCNPATFARDANVLVKNGYQLSQLGIMDMFPHTSHVETIGLFLSDRAGC